MGFIASITIKQASSWLIQKIVPDFISYDSFMIAFIAPDFTQGNRCNGFFKSWECNFLTLPACGFIVFNDKVVIFFPDGYSIMV